MCRMLTPFFCLKTVRCLTGDYLNVRQSEFLDIFLDQFQCKRLFFYRINLDLSASLCNFYCNRSCSASDIIADGILL